MGLMDFTLCNIHYTELQVTIATVDAVCSILAPKLIFMTLQHIGSIYLHLLVHSCSVKE